MSVLILRPQPGGYDKGFEDIRNRLLEIADRANHKTDSDIEISFGLGIVFTDANDTDWRMTIGTDGSVIISEVGGDREVILGDSKYMREMIAQMEQMIEMSRLMLKQMALITGLDIEPKL